MFLPNTNKELIRISNDKLIYIIKDEPNILVKGGDYSIENIIGKEFVDQIMLFNFIVFKHF